MKRIKLFEDFRYIELSITIEGKNGEIPTMENIKDKFTREKLEEYMAENNLSFKDGSWYNRKTIGFTQGIANIKQLLEAIQMRGMLYARGINAYLHFVEHKKSKWLN